MTLRNLKIFVEVCRFKSITLAADELNMAQPAVSSSIRELESYYGVRLFERMNRRIYITEAGADLLSYAIPILEQCEEAKNVLRDTKEIIKLRLGTNHSFGMENLPELLSGFQKQHPQIPVCSMVKNSSLIEEQLLRNNLDIGIIDYPQNHTMFHCRMIGKERMIAAGSEKLVKKYLCGRSEFLEKTEQTQLEEIPFLMREPGSGSRTQLDLFFKERGIIPKVVMESDSIQCMIKAAIAGMGIVLLPQNVLSSYLKSGILCEMKIAGMEIQRRYYLVYHKSKFLTKSMKLFLEYAGEEKEKQMD